MQKSQSIFSKQPTTTKPVVLSIDGGGMRGIIPLAMLVHLEHVTGQPAYTMFDMVAGNSTGAIIAAGLALKMSALEILFVYEFGIAKEFSKLKKYKWFYLAKHKFKYFYETQPFVDLLKPYTKNKKMKDLDGPTLLVTTKDVRTGNTYHVSNKNPLFYNWSVSDAIQASVSAAPYFVPFKNVFIDGGIGYSNNPQLACLENAFLEFNDFTLISLGTGYIPNQFDNISDWSAIRWLEYIFKELMDDISNVQILNAKSIYKDIDIRRYNPSLSYKSLVNFGLYKKEIDIIQSSTIDSSSYEAISIMKYIGTKYAKNIDWSKPDVMPWDTKYGQSNPLTINTNFSV